MNKLKRFLKCRYFDIKFTLGKILCKLFGHTQTYGISSNFERFSLIKICPRCGKVLEVHSTPIL